jgi:hypothetical protein
LTISHKKIYPFSFLRATSIDCYINNISNLPVVGSKYIVASTTKNAKQSFKKRQAIERFAVVPMMQLQPQNYRVITGLLVFTLLFLSNISWILHDELSLILDDTDHRNQRSENSYSNSTNNNVKRLHEEIILLDECGHHHHRLTVPMSDGRRITGSSYRSGTRSMKTERTTTDVAYNDGFCSKEHALAIKQCSPPGSNTVLHFRKQIQESVPFSVQQVGLRQHSGEKDSYNPRSRFLPKCQTISDFINSIKYGTRVWDPKPENDTTHKKLSHSTELEKRPSRFVPSKCYVPVLPPSPDETCHIMNHFSHIFIDGDSLSRHLRQTLIMVLRGGEWSKGALMTNNRETNELCFCDGQYSENYKCRQFDDYFTSPMISPVDIPRWNTNHNSTSSSSSNNNDTYTGLCHNLITTLGGTNLLEARKSMFQLGYSENLRRKSNIPWDQIQCENEDYRGLFITVQGGLHFQNNATTTFFTKMYPIMSNPTYQKCLELNKVQLVWIGATAQSRSLDSEYIHQSREYAVEFNQEMKSLILNTGLPGSDKIIFMDWWNMTADSQTSDGLHSLMDINLAKVSQLLYLMELWNNKTQSIKRGSINGI